MPAQQGQRCLQINCTIQAQLEQRGLCNKGTNASTLRATMPVWQGQWHQCNGAAWRGQQRCNDGDNTHATWGQRDQRNKDGNAGATRVTTPMQCWQWCLNNNWQHCHRDYGKDACVSTMAMMPSWWGQFWWRQQHHCNKGNNVIATVA